LVGGTPDTGQGDIRSDRRVVLYANTGDRFVQSDALPGELLERYSVTSALFLDYDNDGWQDLLLLPRHDEPVFFENRNGSLVHRRVGLNATLGVPIGATTTDFDSDGCLDLFIYQNGDWTETSPVGFRRSRAHQIDQVSGGGNETVREDNGNENLLFDGNCSEFSRVTDAGIEGKRWSLAASSADLTGDGRSDIHVANDYNNDYLYLNRGNWTFEQVQLGEATDRNGMASELADVNRDGKLDIFVTNIYFDLSGMDSREREVIEDRLGSQVRGNNLLINRGNGTFVDQARSYAVQRGGWGWAASIADFDNDGDRDLFHTTDLLEGDYAGATTASYASYPVYRERNGGRFERRDPEEIGLQPGNERGAARLDADRDGHLDLAVAVYAGGEYRLYRNNGSAGNWAQFRLTSDESRTAIGSELYVTVGNVTRKRVYTARTDFLSQDSRIVHVGLGTNRRIDRVRIVWPDGTAHEFSDVKANRRFRVTPDGELRRIPHSGNPPPDDRDENPLETVVSALSELLP